MKNIKGKTFFHESAVCIGGFKSGNELLVIDSGNDDSSAKKAVRGFDNINVRYLFNTHSHADHCGGNSFYSKRYNSAVIAPEGEAAFIQDPLLEPVYLYGSYPPSEMKNKFLFAKPSRVDIIVGERKDLKFRFAEEEYLFKFITLKGHSPDMHGIITPDNIAFLGDALLGAGILEKHGLMFSFDVKSHLESLESLKSLSADGFVLAHGGYSDDITNLIDLNIKSLQTVSGIIVEICSSGSVTFDDLHNQLYERFNLRENLSLNILNRSIIKAHVQYLHDSSEVELYAASGKLLIKRKSLK